MATLNLLRLIAELTAAGIPVQGVSTADGGRIDFAPEATPTQRTTALAILAAHDPAKPTAEEEDRAAARARVLSALATLPGTSVTVLTAQQVRDICVALLWMVGGVDKDYKVKPLSAWLRKID